MMWRAHDADDAETRERAKRYKSLVDVVDKYLSKYKIKMPPLSSCMLAAY